MERKPLPRAVVYLAAVLMWPYFILLGLRELCRWLWDGFVGVWRTLARLRKEGR